MVYLLTQFSTALEQCATRNKRDVYSAVMVIVQHRKYLQTCLKNSRKVPGSRGAVSVSLQQPHKGAGLYLTSSDIQWQQWAGHWLDRMKFGVQWDYPTCFLINLISS